MALNEGAIPWKDDITCHSLVKARSIQCRQSDITHCGEPPLTENTRTIPSSNAEGRPRRRNIYKLLSPVKVRDENVKARDVQPRPVCFQIQLIFRETVYCGLARDFNQNIRLKYLADEFQRNLQRLEYIFALAFVDNFPFKVLSFGCFILSVS